MSYRQKLKELREDADLSQAEIAKILGTTQQQVYKYENQLQEMTVPKLKILCEYYGVSADYLRSANIRKNRSVPSESGRQRKAHRMGHNLRQEKGRGKPLPLLCVNPAAFYEPNELPCVLPSADDWRQTVPGGQGRGLYDLKPLGSSSKGNDHRSHRDKYGRATCRKNRT